MNIVGMTREELLKLKVGQLGTRLLTPTELVYMAETLGAFWQYDYQALEEGRPGLHAELKSGLHSDGFFVSKILLGPPDIEAIIANQMAARFRQENVDDPSLVAGIPDGATELAKQVASFLHVQHALMKKENGRIVWERPPLCMPDSVLLVEDFCTRGTGFREAVNVIFSNTRCHILRIALVIINRGGLQEIEVEGVGKFKVVPIADHRIQDWIPQDCPLCKKGSHPIKPKATEQNWRLITTSQQR